MLDGDEWTINGNKIFTSGADQADYIWLATRTDPDAPKHKGISIFLVPTSSPGFSCTPIVTVGGVATTASYYDNVRVPRTALVGELNEGWRLITGQLNHERVGLAAVSALAQRLWTETAEWAVEQGVADVRLGAGRAGPDLRPARGPEAAQLADDRGGRPTATLGPADSSAVKVFGTEIDGRDLPTAAGRGRRRRLPEPGSPGAVLHGELERAGRQAQINTFGGGVNEVQREILAMAGLGMKRSSR